MEKLGFELDRTAIVPSSGMEVHVTSLSLDRWAQLRAQSTWPMRAPQG